MSTLSRASYDSVAHAKRLSKHRVTEDDLFEYVLRVAYLSYLMQPKVAVSTPTLSEASKEKDKEYSSRISGALSSSIYSIGDLFKDLRDGSRIVKFPKDLVKVLELKLQDIAMGKDPAYSEQLVRRTMAVFYGQIKDESFRKQMKENRKIEELILMFATNATNVLKKDPSLAGDGWKVELNNHISLFVQLLRDCMRSISHVSPELTQRLDMYATKLGPKQPHSDSGYDSASTTRDRDSAGSSTNAKGGVADMSLVLTVSRLFKIPTHAIQGEVEKISKFCTEKVAMTDLKTCLKNLNAGAAIPGRREDFASDAAFQHWRTLETSHLSQLMVAMVQSNPELAKSTPSGSLSQPQGNTRPTSVYSRRESAYSPGKRNLSISSHHSRMDSFSPADLKDISGASDADEDIPEGNHFTFIPPNPKKYYERLLESCLTADLEAMLSPAVGDDDEVSLGILTQPHIELINECALRWRIGQPYRAACFLDLIRQFFQRNEVPMECIPEALQTISKVRNEFELDEWPIQDSDFLANALGSLFSIFLSTIYQLMETIPHLKPADINPYLSVMETIQLNHLLERFEVDITSRISDIQDQVRTASQNHYRTKLQDLASAPGVNRALPLLLMTDDIEKTAKKLDKDFSEPILGKVDVVSLVVEEMIPLFLQELDSSSKRLFQDSMNGPTPDVPIEDIFALYRRTKTMMQLYKAFCPEGDAEFDEGGFFEPYVCQWLINTDNKTTQWVQAAIAADKFQSEGPEGHSSSIVDLFDSLRSPINFLQDLEWSNEYQEARFFTSLSKTISTAVELYCRSIEDMFMTEMFPRPTEFLQPQKSSAWLEKAKQLTQGDKKVEPFNFQPETCVKLNNTHAARRLLDNMYSQMQADKIAAVLSGVAPPVPEKVSREKFLFTVKICIAEGLVPIDSSPSALLDTFVILSDEGGHRLAKTRTIYENLNPRWDETFDLSVEKPLWLMISVRDRALFGKHDIIGRAYICLDPRRFGDMLTHDMWMDFDTQGRILLRISMEGEKDDIEFYFGRAFRSLKRAGSEMLRIFVDKMSPMIRQSLSRSVLRSLLKPGTGGSLDYNKVLGNVTGFYKALSVSSTEVQIPPPQMEKPRVRGEELTDVEVEQAIVPLFDYFDANLMTLNTYLSDTTKEQVMARVWKEILTVIEGLLIPPLSESPSDMKPLSDKEVDIVFRWLKFLRDYFYAGGEGPVPLETLQNQKYRDVVSIRLYYDWHTDALMEECVLLMQHMLRSSSTMKKRAKSVYQQKNLGTIKDRKKKKQEGNKESSNGEIILRILRMRPGTTDFIVQQLRTFTTMQAEQEAKELAKEQRKSQRHHGGGGDRAAIPPVPSPPPPLPQRP